MFRCSTGFTLEKMSFKGLSLLWDLEEVPKGLASRRSGVEAEY